MNNGLGKPEMLRVLYMPTNKPSQGAIAEAVLECQVLATTTAYDYVFTLIEHGPSACDRHSQIMERLAGELEVPCLYFNRERWDEFLGTAIPATGLPSSDQARMHSLLCPDDVAYGAGPNKAALVA